MIGVISKDADYIGGNGLGADLKSDDNDFALGVGMHEGSICYNELGSDLNFRGEDFALGDGGSGFVLWLLVHHWGD